MWYYAKDQQQLGPVPEEEIRALLSRGDIGQDTLVWREGQEDWKPLREVAPFLSEIAPGASSGEVAPPSPQPVAPSPPSPSGTGDSFPETGQVADAGSLIPESYEVRIGDCAGKAWNFLFSERFWVLLGAAAVILVIYMAASQIPFFGALVGIFAGPLFGGLDYYYLRWMRQGQTPFDLVFSGFKYNFGQLILVSVVQLVAALICMLPGGIALIVGAVGEEEAFVIVGAGLLLIGLIPMIYLLVSWWFAPVLCLDKGLPAFEALRVSRATVGKNFFSVLLFSIVTGLISVAGYLAFCIGFFVSFPLATLMFCFFYEDLYGRKSGNPAEAREPVF